MRRLLLGLALVALASLPISDGPAWTRIADGVFVRLHAAASYVTTGGPDADNATDGIAQVVLTAQPGDTFVPCLHDEGTQTVTFSDGVNSYTNSTTKLHTNNSVRVTMAVATNVGSGSTTVTGTLSGNQYHAMYVMQLRGMAASAIVGDSDTSEGIGTTVTGTAMTATSNGMAVGCFATFGGQTIGVGSGWTQGAEQESGMFSTGGIEYRTATAAGSYTPGWTISNSGTDWVTVGFTLNEAVTSSRSSGALRR